MAAATVPARRPSAGAVPGRWGACLAVRTPPTEFSQFARHPGRFCKPSVRSGQFAKPSCIYVFSLGVGALALTHTEIAEHVVVAGSGVVAKDDRQHIDTGDPARSDVEAAAGTLAVAAAEARST